MFFLGGGQRMKEKNFGRARSQKEAQEEDRPCLDRRTTGQRWAFFSLGFLLLLWVLVG